MKSNFLAKARLGAVAIALVVAGTAATTARAAENHVKFSELMPIFVAVTPNAPGLTNFHCAASDEPAKVTLAFAPEFPEIALEQGIAGGTTTAYLKLAANGGILAASVAQSSGNEWLDRAALQAIRMSQFAPEIKDCQAIVNVYKVSVTFAK